MFLFRWHVAHALSRDCPLTVTWGTFYNGLGLEAGSCLNSPKLKNITALPESNFMVAREDLIVRTLGPCTVDSPLLKFLESRPITVNNVAEDDGVLFDDCLSVVSARNCSAAELPVFEPAGPRKKIFFDPSKTRAGIVTCGGLCPGLNNVIRAGNGALLPLRREADLWFSEWV